MMTMLLVLEDLAEYLGDCINLYFYNYNKKNCFSHFRSFKLTKPVLCIADYQVIQQVLVSSSDYFSEQNVSAFECEYKNNVVKVGNTRWHYVYILMAFIFNSTLFSCQ